MRNYGLIGYPLTHSFSESYFRDKFIKEGIKDTFYKNYPIRSLAELPVLIKEAPSLMGLNVTIPYKKDVIEYLNYLDKDAEEAGAVNVIKIIRYDNDIELKGYNTDIYGFMESLRNNLSENVKSALVLGTGGSSAAVTFVLRRLNIDFSYVSRSAGENTYRYEDLDNEIIAAHRLIINTTPLGMYPDTDHKPLIPYNALSENHVLYDLIYNPPETLFLHEGKKAGCLTINGLEMLKLQAEKSWEIWNDPAC
ncbi:MAG: shikimate dehydrogenase [Bacteroidales bacterium]|nr:shikimate dehydrogenase [Bacteroidales bacterium]